MKLTKVKNKWVIKGKGEGWILNKTFPTKWKAEIALEVFKKGGRVSDYWKTAKEQAKKRPRETPWRVTEELEKALSEIKRLDPTCKEIEEYGKDIKGDCCGYGYGVVTMAKGEGYFGPRLHDTWQIKNGGRVHIDIGCCGYHLMLDKGWAIDFIEFIKNKRKETRIKKK